MCALPVPPPSGTPDSLQGVGLLLMIRAFASGSVALTGTEAIANGVPSFKPPEAKNAATTLGAVAVLLAILFLGITFIADSFAIVPTGEGEAPKTVISQVAGVIYGEGTPLFYLFQTFTALILFLAANTSYNAFPRLAAILASDGYTSHLFNYWADILRLTDNVKGRITAEAYEEWMKKELKANTPYDQLVKKLLTTEGGAWDSGSIGF